MIKFKSRGDFKNTARWLERAKEIEHSGVLDKYGRAGVAALAEAVPKDSGLTASSWRYKIINKGGVVKLSFFNDNVIGDNQTPLAILIQYGHATKNGGWVEGIDYINPAVRPIFETLALEMWKEVTR